MAANIFLSRAKGLGVHFVENYANLAVYLGLKIVLWCGVPRLQITRVHRAEMVVFEFCNRIATNVDVLQLWYPCLVC